LGVRLDDGAALNRLDDYSGARALWQPAPMLALRWERYLASATMHLTALVIGRDPSSGAGGVARICDQYFHGTEDETGGGRVPLADGQFMIYLQSRALGTRLIYSEFLYGGAVSRGFTNQFAIDNDSPVIVFNAEMRACAVVLLEDVPSRAPPLPPMLVGPYLAKNLLRLLDTPLMPKAARALGYLGNPAAADAIAARAKSAVDHGDLAALAAALVLLDDPRGLDLGVAPALARHEIEMVRAFAKNERIRKSLLQQ
jgi:hypothetical protein